MNRKKGIVSLAALGLLLAWTSLALAQGTAYVAGGSADRVHLRAECSTQGPSMGLYFTGTPVEVTGDAGNGLSAVVIGTQNGYMMTRYLSGTPVDSLMPTGIISPRNAGSRVNLRGEPIADAPVLGTLKDGAAVRVYGETKGGWYFVDAGGRQGYIKNTLVTLGDAVSAGDAPYPGGAQLVQTLTLDEGGRRILVEVTRLGENPGYGEATYSVRVETQGTTTQSFVYTGGRMDEYWKAVYPTDVNMDGYPDLLLMGIAGASDAFGTHYLYEPVSGRFVEHGELADFSVYRCTLYPQTGYVLNYLHDGAATGSYVLYQWQNGLLVQLARASMLPPEAGITSDKLQAKAERLVRGAWQTVYDETFDLDDEAWQAHDAALLAALWSGIEPGEGRPILEAIH